MVRGKRTVSEVDLSALILHVTVSGGDTIRIPRCACVCLNGVIGLPFCAPQPAGSFSNARSGPISSIERTSQLMSPGRVLCLLGQPSISASTAERVMSSISKPVCIEPPDCAPPAGMRITLWKWLIQAR
jgi:hypothetical protein